MNETPAPGWSLTTQPPRRASMTEAKRTMLVRVGLRLFMALDTTALYYLKAALAAEITNRQPKPITEQEADERVAAYWRELYKKPEENHVAISKSA